MRPIPNDIRSIRNVPVDAFHGMGVRSSDDIPSLVGKVIKEQGFMSTAVGSETGTFSGSRVRMVVEIPKGTPGRYLSDGLSMQGKSERELLLGRDQSFIVHSAELLNVTSSGSYWKITVRML